MTSVPERPEDERDPGPNHPKVRRGPELVAALRLLLQWGREARAGQMAADEPDDAGEDKRQHGEPAPEGRDEPRR